MDRLVAEYEAGGLTRQEFCAKQGLSLTLARYRKRRQQREPSAGASRFFPVELRGTNRPNGSELAVALAGGRCIEVRRGFDAEMLAQLVRVLEQV